MANNDLIYTDQLPTGAQSYAPEAIDAGTAVGPDNVTRKLRRTSVGILLGSFLDFAAATASNPNADVPLANDTWTTVGNSFKRMFAGFWRDSAKDGTDTTMPSGITAPSTGAGIRGWLSAGWIQGQQALQSAGVGSGSFASSQAPLTGTASLIVAARSGVSGTGRIAVTISLTSNVAWYFGPSSGVTASTGTVVPAGQSVTIPTTAAIYGGTVAGGSATASVLETF